MFGLFKKKNKDNIDKPKEDINTMAKYELKGGKMVKVDNTKKEDVNISNIPEIEPQQAMGDVNIEQPELDELQPDGMEEIPDVLDGMENPFMKEEQQNVKQQMENYQPTNTRTILSSKKNEMLAQAQQEENDEVMRIQMLRQQAKEREQLRQQMAQRQTPQQQMMQQQGPGIREQPPVFEEPVQEEEPQVQIVPVDVVFIGGIVQTFLIDINAYEDFMLEFKKVMSIQSCIVIDGQNINTINVLFCGPKRTE